METNYDLLEVIDAIDPAACSYEEWVQVGMALKDAGHTASEWDAWSQRDGKRYHVNECYKKWDSFRGSNTPVTGGTVVAIARSQGWTPPSDEGYALEWDGVIGPRDEGVIIRDTAWVEAEDVPEPDDWDPVREITTYLSTLFGSEENVGYVTKAWEREGRYLPQKGNWDRTAGELIDELNRCGGDIGRVLGDYRPEVGAWIRFNPLDGRGCKNENVTEFRYALVESDTMPVDKQYAIIRELELPVAALVHSGGKSLHAIVRVDAPTYDEYRKRVDHLYDVCKRNGLVVDTQNKNPSRLSRMPGVERAGHKQFLVATSVGRESWAEWVAWLEESADVLPVDVTTLADEWDEEVPVQAAVIDGMLGTNEKMMLAGSSKAGKTVALLELVAAIANGDEWMGARCRQGHTLFVNFELKRESRIRRVKEIFAAKGYPRSGAELIHFLDLRGHSAPLDQLISKIVRQAAKYGCSTIVIDPIYKVMSGDENNAEAVGRFCNDLDALSRRMDCSIVYCHHFSKGQQGQKASIDRASGSGVFARDADALLSMIELEVTDDIRSAYVNAAECALIPGWLEARGEAHALDDVSRDVLVASTALRSHLAATLPTEVMNALIGDLAALRARAEKMSAWRIECTLRDFAPRHPVDIWYRYPIHEIDADGILADAKVKDTIDPVKQAQRKRSERAQKERTGKHQALTDAVENANFGEPPTTAQAMAYLGMDPNEKADKDRFYRLVKTSGEYVRECVDKTANLWIVKRKDANDER